MHIKKHRPYRLCFLVSSYNAYLQMPALESFQYNYICSYDTRTDQEYEGQSNCPEEVSLTSRTEHIK